MKCDEANCKIEAEVKITTLSTGVSKNYCQLHFAARCKMMLDIFLLSQELSN
jgi:hypothetical protein